LQKAENLRTIEAARKSSCSPTRCTNASARRREHTEDWQTIQHETLWPEQTWYELLRHVVPLGDPAGKRAQETGSAERTLFWKADTETEQSMVSLARIPRLENSLCAICVKPSAMDSRRVDKYKENRAELKENKLLCFSRFQQDIGEPFQMFQAWKEAERTDGTLSFSER
jgi:hypothetical protein